MQSNFHRNGNTPLHEASKRGDNDHVKTLVGQANINAVNSGGRTPLHLACLHGHSECVRVLVLEGADTSLRDNRALTAEDLVKHLLNRPLRQALYTALGVQERSSEATDRDRIVIHDQVASTEFPTFDENDLKTYLSKKLRKLDAVTLGRILAEVSHATKWIRPEQMASAVQGKQVDVIFVAHGHIKDDLITADEYFRSQVVHSVTFYAPWNCQLDATAAIGVITLSLKTDLSEVRFIGQEVLTSSVNAKAYPACWNVITRQESGQKLPAVVLSPTGLSQAVWQAVLELDSLFKPRRLHSAFTYVIPYIDECVNGKKPHKCYFTDIVTIAAVCFRRYTGLSSVRFHLAACLISKELISDETMDTLVKQYGYGVGKLSQDGHERLGCAVSCDLENLDPAFANLENRQCVDKAKAVLSTILL